jgi:DNA repair exonuclease SbcCD ATPase subunit
MKLTSILPASMKLRRRGEGEGGGDGDEPKTVTMTQEQFDKVIQDRLDRDRKTRQADDAKAKTALAELQKLQATLKMTDEEKQALQTQVEEMESQLLTKEEIQAKERKKAQEKYDAELKAAQERALAAESRYTNSRIETELTTGAVGSGVHKKSVPFVLSYLRQNTKVVPVVDDDGKPTGTDKVVIAYKDGDDVAELSVQEVFEKMAEDTDNYGNLFDSKARGGLGAGNGTPGKKTGYRPGMSTEEYYKLRKENPASIYGS